MYDWSQIWRLLSAGRDLAGLGLGKVSGRWDLRGIKEPATPWSRREPNPTFRRATLRGLDFSEGSLNHFRFFDCSFVDCIFDNADLSDSRLWGSSIIECSFRGAQLGMVGMGGDRRHPNSWTDVDFSRADLRNSAHYAERYTNCEFSDSLLNRVNFEGSVHEGSVFSGRMEEVEFRATPRDGRRSSAKNEMSGVVLTRATVRFSSFNMLNLGAANLPRGLDYLQFEERGRFARMALEAARKSQSTNVSLRVMMEVHVRDAPPGGGGPGFQHKLDLGETDAEVREAVALLMNCGAR